MLSKSSSPTDGPTDEKFRPRSDPHSSQDKGSETDRTVYPKKASIEIPTNPRQLPELPKTLFEPPERGKYSEYVPIEPRHDIFSFGQTSHPT